MPTDGTPTQLRPESPDCDPPVATGHKTSRGNTAPVLRARARSTPQKPGKPLRKNKKRNQQQRQTRKRNDTKKFRPDNNKKTERFAQQFNTMPDKAYETPPTALSAPETRHSLEQPPPETTPPKTPNHPKAAPYHQSCEQKEGCKRSSGASSNQRQRGRRPMPMLILFHLRRRLQRHARK